MGKNGKGTSRDVCFLSYQTLIGMRKNAGLLAKSVNELCVHRCHNCPFKAHSTVALKSLTDLDAMP